MLHVHCSLFYRFTASTSLFVTCVLHHFVLCICLACFLFTISCVMCNWHKILCILSLLADLHSLQVWACVLPAGSTPLRPCALPILPTSLSRLNRAYLRDLILLYFLSCSYNVVIHAAHTSCLCLSFSYYSWTCSYSMVTYADQLYGGKESNLMAVSNLSWCRGCWVQGVKRDITFPFSHFNKEVGNRLPLICRQYQSSLFHSIWLFQRLPRWATTPTLPT